VFGLEGIFIANRFNSSDARFLETVITYSKGMDPQLLVPNGRWWLTNAVWRRC
jgi:hypothetical protein